MSTQTAPVTLIGNLVADPELKFTPSGAAVANFTVAATPRIFDKAANEHKDGETSFFRCVAWRQAAEDVAQSLRKGQRVIVTGDLSIRNFERPDGSKGSSTEVKVEEVGASVKFASRNATPTPTPAAASTAAAWGAPEDRPF